MGQIRMADVARKAGVNGSTVSRALRRDPSIPITTCQRIQDLAEAMGYRPNPLITALMTARRKKGAPAELGVIAFLQNEPVLRVRQTRILLDFEKGANARALQFGYRLEVFHVADEGLSPRRLNQILEARGIVGLCVPPLKHQRGHLSLNWSRLASATIGYSLLRPALHRVSADQHYNMLLLLRELRRLGYRKIGLCVHQNISKRMDDLWLGAFFAFQHRHPDMTLSLHEGTGSSFSEPLFQRWSRRAKLEVIISDTPHFEETCRRLAGPVAFASLNWIPEMPHQMGIDQGGETIAFAAVDLIVAQLNGNERGVPEKPKTVSLPGTWRSGATCTP